LGRDESIVIPRSSSQIKKRRRRLSREKCAGDMERRCDDRIAAIGNVIEGSPEAYLRIKLSEIHAMVGSAS
jgi:hypothetical protein